MKYNFVYIIILALLALSCRDNNTRLTSTELPLLSINPAEFIEASFNLSDFADSIVFIELASDYPFVGTVEQIISDRMLVYDQYKSFKFLDRKGRLLGKIGKVGQGVGEYIQNGRGATIGMLDCFYDNHKDSYVVYSSILTKRGLRLRYYDGQGGYYGSVRLNHPYPENISITPDIYFSEGYYYLPIWSSSLKEGVAVVGFDSKGNVVREFTNDVHRSCFARAISKPTNYYRDHLLLWGFNDTIYVVRGEECIPTYRWEIPQDMRRKLDDIDVANKSVGAVQANEFSPSSIVDTKKWLIVRGYINPSFYYYYYSKEEGKWYGNSAPKNDLGYYAFGNAMCFFDGYYYDEAKDEEWLYHTFNSGDKLLELLEEADDPRSMAMRKELSKKDDINPILVMVRLKK